MATMTPPKVALVTGGGSGIGKSVCHVLSQDGYSVVVADLNVEAAEDVAAALHREGCQKHLAVQVDVSNSESVRSVFDQNRQYIWSTRCGRRDICRHSPSVSY